jgi:hypothetical protein
MRISPCPCTRSDCSNLQGLCYLSLRKIDLSHRKTSTREPSLTKTMKDLLLDEKSIASSASGPSSQKTSGKPLLHKKSIPEAKRFISQKTFHLPWQVGACWLRWGGRTARSYHGGNSIVVAWKNRIYRNNWNHTMWRVVQGLQSQWTLHHSLVHFVKNRGPYIYLCELTHRSKRWMAKMTLLTDASVMQLHLRDCSLKALESIDPPTVLHT